MKKVFAITLALLLALSGTAFAGVEIFQDGAEKGHVAQMNCSTGVTCTKVGDRVNVVSSSSPVAAITSGTIAGTTINTSVIGGVTPAAITGTTIGGTVITGSGVLSTTDATDASNLTTASVVTAGGLAVAKQIFVGDDIDMSVNGTGVYDITLKDAVADALSIVRGTTDMMVFDSATPKITITPATTITGDLTETGAIIANGAVTLGNAIGDITTFTGKIAGATPISFDGDTADAVYTIFAITDPTSASKTITFPAATGTVALTGATNNVLAQGYEMVTTTSADPGLGTAALTTLFTDITSDATGSSADQVSLAAGTAGQMKVIQLAVDAETTGTSIEANFYGATAHALLEDAGDVLVLVSDGTEWHIVLNTGATLS